MADYREMMDKMRREGQMERERIVRPSPTTGPKSFAMVNAPGSYSFGPGTYKGSGGYEYEVKGDGSIRIAKSPKSAGGQEVLPGAKFHDVIMEDIQRAMDTETRLAEMDKPAPVMDMGEEFITGTLPMAKTMDMGTEFITGTLPMAKTMDMGTEFITGSAPSMRNMLNRAAMAKR